MISHAAPPSISRKVVSSVRCRLTLAEAKNGAKPPTVAVADRNVLEIDPEALQLSIVGLPRWRFYLQQQHFIFESQGYR